LILYLGIYTYWIFEFIEYATIFLVELIMLFWMISYLCRFY